MLLPHIHSIISKSTRTQKFFLSSQIRNFLFQTWSHKSDKESAFPIIGYLNCTPNDIRMMMTTCIDVHIPNTGHPFHSPFTCIIHLLRLVTSGQGILPTQMIYFHFVLSFFNFPVFSLNSNASCTPALLPTFFSLSSFPNVLPYIWNLFPRNTLFWAK